MDKSRCEYSSEETVDRSRCEIRGRLTKILMNKCKACREHLRIEKLKNQGLQTQVDALEARCNVYEAGRQDNNTAGQKQDLATEWVLRNLTNKEVALRCVNFSAPPNHENYDISLLMHQ
ncbi:uncharacterized protein LOC113286892 isoform X1 [Papaver somniferum]|uniref:uncharacterized protein LOC113286892 isoform X1 n=1 Tax=Papaver somniferum TaxID=3469 RepID=UPI000E6FEE7D|nr:uncharacterized protein LOC113286892 isoform X1 [Papaver somniferum]